MCTTCSHDVAVGFGGSVVVLVVLVVVVDVVDVELVVELVEVLVVSAASVDEGGTTVVAVPAVDGGANATVVRDAPSVDWTRSLHAAAPSTSSTSATAAIRLRRRSRPTAPPRAVTSLLALAPSTPRDGR
jgi:hypothetical protein